MDRYTRITRVPDFNSIVGRAEVARNIWNAIQTRCCLCIYGKPGCGKTYILRNLLGQDYFEFDETSDTSHHVVVEEPSNDIIERIKSGGPLTRGSTILVCSDLKRIDFCDCIEIPQFTETQLNTLFPGYPREAKMCGGNMWNFEFYKQFHDKKDTFMNPKEYVQYILSTARDTYIKSSIEEHGHTWGMIHENYPDTRNLTMDECGDIAECMSLADVYDQKIYESDWDLCRYFQITGIALPAYIIRGRYDKSLRPGSSWTKMNNQKMRSNKLKKFGDFDTNKYILILKTLMTHPNPREFAKLYTITPHDIDVLNHLLLGSKFKPQEITRLKKKVTS